MDINKQRNLLHTEQLGFWYNPENIIFDNINIAFNDNEFTAIAGQNGCGKTTLLKIFTGLLRPQKGNFFIRGKNTREMKTNEIAGEIGFIMQDVESQLFEATVYDETAFSLRHAAVKIPENIIRQKTEESLSIVGMIDKRDAFPQALGRADKVKTVFAAVLAMGPKIIILDEPAAGHDRENCRLIMDIASNLREKGYTIIMVSHNMNIIAEYAERLVVLKSSAVFLDGKPREVFEKTSEMAEANLRPPQINRFSRDLQKHLKFGKNALTPEELTETFISLK